MEEIMLESLNDLNAIQLDILREIASIGSSKAVTALSKLLNDMKIGLNVPAVKYIEFQNIANTIGGAHQIVFGVLITLSGDIDGKMVFVMRDDSAAKLLKLLMGPSHSTENLMDEFNSSTMTEIANILSSSYISALGQLSGLTIQQSLPFPCIDMANAVLSVPAIEFGMMSDRVLFFDSVFKTHDADISGYFILVPDIESFNRIFRALGVH
jgi:chemotaxis protein CheC